MLRCSQCQAELADNARFCPFCGSASVVTPSPSGDPMLGRTVNGKFRVDALLGQGGMGRVYKATHLTLERTVVLKVLHRGFSEDPSVAERFHREAKAASRLNHPNSIAVLDFGQIEDGTLFMAMEYLGGRNLAQVISEDHPIPESRVIRIGAQILSALAEAHAHGIIHRDLKPENVMVEPRREEADFVKVLDFGIAKISDPGPNEAKLTQQGLVCGTPEYMSPEQSSGRELDARSDLYSMGVILYQMLTGDLPFQANTPLGYLTAHLNQAPQPPSQKRPDLTFSPALEALVMRALSKRREERSASAEEMRASLLACAAPASKPAPPPAPERTSPPGNVKKTLVLGLVAVVLAVAAGGWVLMAWPQWWVRIKRGPQPTEPVAGLVPKVTPPTSAPREAPGQTIDGTATQVPGQAAPPRGPETTQDGSTHPADSSPPPPKAGDRSRAVELYRQAEERRAEQDVDGAIQLYLQAEAADPALPNVQKKLAVCYQLKGDRASAVARYRKYLAFDPEDAAAVRQVLQSLGTRP